MFSFTALCRDTAACVLLLMLLPGQAVAERVSVVSHYGSEGQGWLFGAAAPGGALQCWIVIPRHVIEGEFDDPAMPFLFTDESGVSGQSGQPTVVADINGGLEIMGGVDDLAFAPVISGRMQGKCLSRLGLPVYSYAQVLRKLPAVNFYNMLNTSFDLFQLRVARVRVDQFGGAVMALRSADASVSNEQFEQGLSGAIGEVSWRDQLFPFVMIIRLKKESGEAVAIRFDAIKQVFELLNAGYQPLTEINGNYTLVSYRIKPGANPAKLDSLLDGQSCWYVEPHNPDTAVEFVVSVDSKIAGISGIKLFHESDCAKETVAYSVDQKVAGADSWVRVRDCKSVVGNSTPSTCYTDLSTPRLLRLRFQTGKALSLSGLDIY